MKTHDLIELLKKLDPNGVLEVFSSMSAKDEVAPINIWVDRLREPTTMSHAHTAKTPHKAILI